MEICVDTDNAYNTVPRHCYNNGEMNCNVINRSQRGGNSIRKLWKDERLNLRCQTYFRLTSV